MQTGSGLRIDFSTQSYRGKTYSMEFCEGFELPCGFCIVLCSGENGINHEGGSLAAKLALEGIKKHFQNNPVRNIQSSLQRAMILANFMVYDHAMKNERFRGMGVNIAVVVVWNDLIYYAAKGKVFILLERQSVLYQLYKPEHLTSEGQSSLLGVEKNASFHLSKNPIQAVADDAIFCANQNLTQEFPDEQIAELLTQEDISIDLICYQIVYKLNETQAPENYVIAISRLVDKTELPPLAEAPKQKSIEKSSHGHSKKRMYYLIATILGLFAIIIFILIRPGETIEDPLVKPKSKTEQTETKSTEITPPVETSNIKENKSSETKISSNKSTIIEHKIEKGESLFRIALRYNVSVSELEQLNKIKAANLKYGQKIKIPIIAKHAVANGETLSIIADKYHVQVSDITKANGIKNNQPLKVGQMLIVPRSSK
ncbi:MAG TPA: LysM peptidoglycan-binding domain-containing protein [Salinivirgaceae bacterium]|nr:LysM peptidoglycan-binding domain-containing protein [Salinivirgaceae bacterium]